MIIRKKKRKKVKITKELKEISKSKRIYRKRLQQSLNQENSTSNLLLMKDTTFEMKKIEVETSKLFMRNYIYFR
jgi:hypothetical protein